MTGSHEAWANGYQRHSQHEVEVLGGIRQGWRATFDYSASQLAARVGSPPDVVVASSMLDLATFRTASGLATTPMLMYFHENQLTYDRSEPDRKRGTVNWRSAQAADRVAFNSWFHLNDFHTAVRDLGVDPALVERGRRAAAVLPVGIDPSPPASRYEPVPTILWNHRWEHDKDPASFVAAIRTIADLPFQLILLGEGRAADGYQAEIRAVVGERVVHAGFAPRAEYLELLGRSHLVVSTARQEFFGVSIAEAMAAGVIPVVPNRLAYPELLGPGLAKCLYEPGTLAERLARILTRLEEWLTLRAAVRAAGARFDWKQVAPRYDQLIDSMV